MSIAEALKQANTVNEDKEPEMATEKRKHPRFAFEHDALVIGHGMRKAYITDISAEGIGLIVKDGDMLPKEYIKLCMLEDESSKMFMLSGTVRHVEGTKCGIQLIKPEHECAEFYQRLLMNAKLNESKASA
jgi:hypothetical protein